jgi:alcohol dehydrogenase
MKATIFHGPRDVRVESVPDPKITAPNQAIVRITRAAICGSDMHSYHGRDQMLPGFVLGHEAIGIVEETGTAVTHIKKGQRVVIACVVSCGECFFCRRGQPSQCSETGSAVLGFGKNAAGKLGDVGGCQSEAISVPFADYTLYPLPESITDEQAVFLADILPTGFFGALNGDIRPGDTVAIYGCGPVGLCALLAAGLFGPSEIISIDTVPHRLELAQKLGATAVNVAQANQTIMDRTNGRGADVCIEAVGSEAALNDAFLSVRGAGTVSMIGVVGTPTFAYPMMLAFMKNLTFRAGIANMRNNIPHLARLIEKGRLDPTPLVSHILPLNETPHGYQIFDARSEGALKVLIKP